MAWVVFLLPSLALLHLAQGSTTGWLTSPNHPDGYPPNLERTDTISVEQGLKVSLQFTSFNIDGPGSCPNDYVTITDGDGTTLMGRSCGTSLPSNVISQTNVVKIFFRTNQVDPRAGWNVTWSAVTPGSVCSYPIPPTLGQPCTLAGALDCPYEIVIDNQGYAGECCCGRCDLDMTCAPDSTTGSGLWQPMHSTLCPTEGCGSAGVVTSPNHPGGYPNNLQKTQTIRVEEGLVVSLHFTVFALDLGDYLSITDGDGTTLMGRTKGYSKPANITSKTNVVKLLFTTNEHHSRTGWSVNWSAVTPGQVVVGGFNGNRLSSVELFPPSDTCSIPDLPQARFGHSLSLLSGGRLVVCGGYDGFNYLDSCISWVAGYTSWTSFYTMSMVRSWHTAWTPPSLPDSIVLLSRGQSGAQLKAEIVPGGATFSLRHSGANACMIPDGETVILTGGRIHSFVTRYNVNGYVEELPQLPESRHGHACAALPATGALVVAGGESGDAGSGNYLSTVLTLLPGAKAWTPLASLPRTLAYARASIVGGKMRVTGGYDGSSRRSEVLEYQPGPPDRRRRRRRRWLVVGNLRVARNSHAVLSIGPNQLPCL